MKIMFQNPDTGETIYIEDLNLLIRDVAKKIVEEYNLKKPPIFFTLMRENPETETYIEEDDSLKKIYEEKLDEKTPIWWRSSELNPDLIYQLRTDRYERSGYELDKIGKVNIFIAGVGLLGADIALDCAVLGIKKLTILDYGSVDWFNIYRQSLYSKKDVFRSKVEVAKENLESMGGINVTALKLEIPSFINLPEDRTILQKSLTQIEEEIKRCDIVITALDTFSARMMVQTIALANEKILINTAAGLVGGIVHLVRIKENDPCLACGVYFDRNQDVGACTLASFGTPKIVSGITMELLTNLIEQREIKYNHFKYIPQTYQIERDLFVKGKAICDFCDKDSGIISKYKKGDRNSLIDWLY
ncbi:MAG: ThiF family adenylyltransferase [Candidatus Helarchaeota archaeon]